MASGSETPQFKPPPERYEVDNLIVDIAKEISLEELETLKHRFSSVIRRNVETPRDLLNHLRNEGFIGRYNILYIQQIVRVLGRSTLIEILENYIEMFEDDKILHFVKKTTETANGYAIVEFHILGPLDTNNLEEKRREIARLLLCPIHEIIIKGIQETHSILLTIMIPKMYVDFLLEQLQKYNQRIIKSFLQLEVDKVIVKKDEFLLQKQDGIYKVKKSAIALSQAKRVKMVSKVAKPEGGHHQTPSGSAMKRKRSSPEKESRRTKSRSENVFGTRQFVTGPEKNGIRTRSYRLQVK